MNTGHSLHTPIFLRFMEAAALACRHATEGMHAAWTEHHARQVRSRLPARLRYDIGELDTRPAASPTSNPHPGPTPIDLETLWNRYGC